MIQMENVIRKTKKSVAIGFLRPYDIISMHLYRRMLSYLFVWDGYENGEVGRLVSIVRKTFTRVYSFLCDIPTSMVIRRS